MPSEQTHSERDCTLWCLAACHPAERPTGEGDEEGAASRDDPHRVGRVGRPHGGLRALGGEPPEPLRRNVLERGPLLRAAVIAANVLDWALVVRATSAGQG